MNAQAKSKLTRTNLYQIHIKIVSLHISSALVYMTQHHQLDD